MRREGEDIDVWEVHQPVASCMCPDWELNQQPFGSQAGAQSNEPQQPGYNLTFLWKYLSHFEILYLLLLLIIINCYYINVCLPQWNLWYIRPYMQHLAECLAHTQSSNF